MTLPPCHSARSSAPMCRGEEPASENDTLTRFFAATGSSARHSGKCFNNLLGFGKVEAVTDPGFGKKVFGFRGQRLDLAAKLVNENPKILHLIAVVRPPHSLKQLAVRHHAVRASHP